MTMVSTIAHDMPDTSQYVAEGRHLMLTLHDCPSPLLDDEAFLCDMAERAVAATGATVLQVMAHQFDPQGVTILVLLSESHASLHTYPEVGVAFWDCFTCGWNCDPEQSAEVLIDALAPGRYQHECVLRGEGADSQRTPGMNDG
jgi:S-adenosylmethionine decarboxylase